MKKIFVFKVKGLDGVMPDALQLREIRNLLRTAASDVDYMIVSGFEVKREIFEIPDGAEIVVSPDLPLTMKVAADLGADVVVSPENCEHERTMDGGCPKCGDPSI